MDDRRDKYPARMDRDGRPSRGTGRSKARSTSGPVPHPRSGGGSGQYLDQRCGSSGQSTGGGVLARGPPGYLQAPASGSSQWIRGPPSHQQQSFKPPIRTAAPPHPRMSDGRGSLRSNGGGGDGEPGAQSSVSRVATERGVGDGDTNFGRGGMRSSRPIPTDILKTRPEEVMDKKGKTGAVIRLQTNYFRLMSRPDWCLYQYRVDFAPEVDHTATRRRLLRTAIKDVNLSGYIFEGTVLYVSRKFPNDSSEFFVDGEGAGVSDATSIRITIRLVGNLQPTDYHNIQVFNLIVRKCMRHLKLKQVGRNFFDPNQKINLRDLKMELWPGYITSIRQHEQEILMCTELAHKYMRQETAYEVLMQCIHDGGRNFQNTYLERMVGCTVLTDYNNKTYRVDDVDFNLNPTHTFQKQDGTSISYIQYYQEKYGLNIANRTQPMLISRAKQREIRAGMSETVILIPELCRCTGLTDAQRNNVQLMRELCQHTNVGPDRKVNMLLKFSRRLAENQPFMQDIRDWDFRLAQNILELSARELPNETVTFGGNRVAQGRNKADWNESFRNVPMFISGQIHSWIIIYPNRMRRECNTMVNEISRLAKGMQMNIPQPQTLEIPDDRINTYLSAMNELPYKQKDLTMIVCMVTNNKADRYAAIKKKSLVELGILSQVITGRIFRGKQLTSIMGKVLTQISTKCGGTPWTVRIPLKRTMVVGYDVCHDSSNKQRSYGAVVCSTNETFSEYYSMSTPHNAGEELSNHIGIAIIAALPSFLKKNGTLPDKLIVYRDGVGEGDLQYVVEHEIAALEKCVNDYYHAQGLPNVRVLFIVVNKRINTRLFLRGNRGTENPKPGTIVDDVITLPERYDFYMVAQCTRQGTVSPTYYNILKNTIGLDPDKIQMLTYKFCHLYFNVTQTVSVPAPVHYAHRLAFLTSQSIKQTVKRNLNDYLYYL